MILQASAVVAAFNLVCMGTEQGHQYHIKLSDNVPVTATPTTERKFREVYRVNLSTKRWCRDDCLTTRPLVAISDSELIFEDPLRAGDLSDRRASRVSRESGELLGSNDVGTTSFKRRGVCERARFTGFPARKF